MPTSLPLSQESKSQKRKRCEARFFSCGACAGGRAYTK